MRPGSLTRMFLMKHQADQILMAGLLCAAVLAVIIGCKENRYKIDSQDHEVKESQIEGRHIGQDPFAFETAEQMYQTGPAKPYDAAAGKLIDTIDNKFPGNYADDGQDGFTTLLLGLHPYRKTEPVQNAIQKWARLYAASMPEAPSNSLKSKILKVLKKIGLAGDGCVAQANALYLKKDFAAASDKYREQLRAAPRHPDARCNLALSQLHLGNDLLAQFELELLRLIKPDYLPAQINLSVVLERAGRSEEAGKLAVAAAVSRKNVAVAAFNAAWFHSLDGEYEKAVNALSPISQLEIKPKYTSFHQANTALLKRYGKVHKPKVIQKIHEAAERKQIKENKEVQQVKEPKAVQPVLKTQEKMPVQETQAPPKPRDAVHQIKPKATQQHLTPEAMYQNARKYHLKTKEYKKAMDWYRNAADKGHAASMTGIGSMYDYGEGVAKNYGQAALWYRRAADKGHATAMYNLGVIYAQGKGVSQDMDQAIKWYRKAADQGDADAMNNLGVIYETGQGGVIESPGGAIKWYGLAAEMGHAGAMANLGRLYENGSGVTKDRVQAIHWYEKAAAKGNADAMNSLGLICEENKDDADAVKWYRKAADKGHAGAIGNLGYCYETGQGVRQNPDKAMQYYRKAAKIGNHFAEDALRRLE